MLATAQLLSVKQVADYLGVHEQTVRALIRKGELEALQPRGRGHALFIEKETVDEWLRGGEAPDSVITSIRPRPSQDFSPRSAA
jgi:excisionase family DNA binding protein